MGFGHRPNSHGAGLPSAKSLWSLAVSAKPSKVSACRHKSSKASASRHKSSKASASRHKSSKVVGQVFKGQVFEGFGPRPVGQVFKGSGPRPVGQVFKGLGQVLMVSVRLTRHRTTGWVPISPPYRYTLKIIRTINLFQVSFLLSFIKKYLFTESKFICFSDFVLIFPYSLHTLFFT